MTHTGINFNSKCTKLNLLLPRTTMKRDICSICFPTRSRTKVVAYGCFLCNEHQKKDVKGFHFKTVKMSYLIY